MRVVLTPYQHRWFPDAEIISAWRVTEQHSDPGGIAVVVDEFVEEPDADPLVLLQYPDGVLPVGKLRHLVLWRDKLWWCEGWRSLLGELKVGFGKISLPLVKRAYPALLASSLVGVQPLVAPSGLLFYLRYQYSKTKALAGN